MTKSISADIQSPSTNDTICAISTPPGIGGIAVARVSGPQAIAITDKIWRGKALCNSDSHTAHLGTIVDTDGNPLDQAVATIFRGPRSFTGEDTVEISVHGSKYIQRQLLNTLTANGCRIAEPGEFTRRAFTSGRLDLAQAEAVADLIASSSRAAHRIAINQMRGTFSKRLTQLRQQLIDLTSLLELELDFSEEDVEFASRQHLRDIAIAIRDEFSRLYKSFDTGAAIKDGIPVAIIGATNAGKSSLLNALLGDEKAIVSDIHGTTRDIVEDTLQLGDYTFRFMDTAGIRHTSDQIESIGIQRSLNAAARARIILLVIDASRPLDETIGAIDPQLWSDIPADATLIITLNKTDLPTLVTPTDATTYIRTILPTTSSPTHPNISSDKPTSATIEASAATRTAKPANAEEQAATRTANAEESAATCPDIHTISISAATGQGIDSLTTLLTQAAHRDHNPETDILITNARHAAALAAALQSIDRAIDAIDANLSGDLIAQDIRETLHHTAQITGEISTTDILQTIFHRFCIGK